MPAAELPTLPSSLHFDLALICRLLPQPTQIYARSVSPATSRSADCVERLTTHPFAPAFTASSLRVASLILEYIALPQLRRPSKRSSCNCRTPSCYVAIPTFHDNRTGTIACFILFRCSVFLSHRKRSCRPGILSKSDVCSDSWSIKSRLSFKFPHFEPCGASPRCARPAGRKKIQAFGGGLKIPVVATDAYRV